MNRIISLSTVIVLLGAACGGDGGDNLGGGTQTLFVDARIDKEGDTAFFEIDVERNQLPVDDAIVLMRTSFGDYTVPLDVNRNGRYVGGQNGWAASYYIRVDAGADWLDGSIGSPDSAELVEPDPLVTIVLPADPNVDVLFRWSGQPAELVRINTRNFTWEGTDVGQRGVPSRSFTDCMDNVDLRRTRDVTLVGGTVGSRIRARVTTSTDITVALPACP